MTNNMKNILLFFAAILAAGSASAQFVMTPGGLRTSGNSAKNYVVADIPGKSQQEIFEAVEQYVYLNFCYDGCAIDTLCYKTISVTVNYPRGNDKTMVLKGPNFDYRTNADMLSYKIVYHIKDGKLRMDVPQLHRYCLTVDGYTGAGFIPKVRGNHKKYALYDAKGRPAKHKQQVIDGIGRYFSNMLLQPVETLTDNW